MVSSPKKKEEEEEKEEEEKEETKELLPGFVVFADFHGTNAMSDIELLL